MSCLGSVLLSFCIPDIPAYIVDVVKHAKKEHFVCSTCKPIRTFATAESLKEHYRGSPHHPNCSECGIGFQDDKERDAVSTSSPITILIYMLFSIFDPTSVTAKTETVAFTRSTNARCKPTTRTLFDIPLASCVAKGSLIRQLSPRYVTPDFLSTIWLFMFATLALSGETWTLRAVRRGVS